MSEDETLNAFVKGALEGSVAATVTAVSIPRVRRVAQRRMWMRRLRRWSMPAIAAGLVGVLAWTVLLRTSNSTGRVTDIICLLADANDLTLGTIAEGTNPSDLLLAWQDAPCNDAL